MSAVNQVHSAMNTANLVGQAGLMNAAATANIFPSGILSQSKLAERAYRPSPSKVVFSAKIEVTKVANGYLVNIGRTEGYEYEAHIAHTVEDVNAIITAQMVAFRLEGD